MNTAMAVFILSQDTIGALKGNTCINDGKGEHNMDHMKILGKGKGSIFGGSGFMSHRWSLLGIQVTSHALIIGFAISIAVLTAAATYMIRKNTENPKTGLYEVIISDSMIVIAAIIIFWCGLSYTYMNKYSPNNGDAQAFTSSYAINPDDAAGD